jgi:hypothetical protein
MRQSRLIAVAILILAALSAPAYGANPARPGTVNYVEGQVSIQGQTLDASAIGTAELQPGQSLDTQAGKAEILLTPGAFFRLGDESSVTMISPSLTDTELRLDKGRATVEIAELRQQNNIVVNEDGALIRLLKTGLYDFDAERNVVRVYQGQARVWQNGQDIEVKGGRQLALNDAGLKAEKFDKEQAQDDLYQWSSLRSSYLAEANVDRDQVYAMGNWYGSGWDWDPYFAAYTYIPGDGIFYSPFGWGFYSPWYVGYAPFFFYGHHYEHFDHDWHRWGGGHDHYIAHFDHGSYHGPASNGHSGLVAGMHGHDGAHGGEGFHGGQGFHGAEGSHGGGGFHGGEGFHGDGGFHGGGGFQGGGGSHSGGGGGGGHH